MFKGKTARPNVLIGIVTVDVYPTGAFYPRGFRLPAACTEECGVGIIVIIRLDDDLCPSIGRFYIAEVLTGIMSVGQ